MGALMALVAALCALPACASSGRGQPAAYPTSDAFVARLEALALIQTINANILSSTSATTTLERWCRDHELAEPPRITATRVQGVERAATSEQRARLGVSEREIIKHRRVQLRCGDRMLSEADNWYVPGRLTTEMNRLLDTTETPFGRAVQPLAPYRRTLEVRMLWTPLPEGWERQPRQAAAAVSVPLAIPDALFEHRAVLYTRDHTPFSEVHEVYQRDLLAFLLAKTRQTARDKTSPRPNIVTNEATFRPPLEMSAERSEAKQTAVLAERSRVTLRATRRFEAELRK